MEPEQIREVCTRFFREVEGWPSGLRRTVPTTVETLMVFPEHAATLIGDEGHPHRFAFMQTVTRYIGRGQLPRETTSGGATTRQYHLMHTIPDTYTRYLDAEDDDQGIYALSLALEVRNREVGFYLAHLGMALGDTLAEQHRIIADTAYSHVEVWKRYCAMNLIGVPQKLAPYERAVELRGTLETLAGYAGALPVTLLGTVCHEMNPLRADHDPFDW